MHLDDLATGIIYKNPKPHVKSVHAYFPSVAVLPEGELLALYTLGEAFEAANLHVHVARSRDGGQTWEEHGPLCPATDDRLTSDFARVTIAADGELVANVLRSDRTAHPDEGLSNPENMGFVPTELLITRSSDGGRHWSEPATVVPPLVGCEFEMCSPITMLRDGRWLWPTSLWRNWQGNLSHDYQMCALVSRDRGHTWPEYQTVMRSPGNNVLYWESKIIELAHNSQLAVAWAYDEAAHRDLPNQYAMSHDRGRSWSEPLSTGILGQTLTPLLLGEGRILSVYRRMDQPGLWACVSRLEDDRWVNDGQQPLWGHTTGQGTTNTGENMVENFNTLRFGAPSLTRLPGGRVFCAFWCYEETISVIRWFSFTVR